MTTSRKTRTLRVLSVFLAAVILLCAALSPQANAASSASNYENAVLFWTNVERSRHGLSKLKTTDALCDASGVRAKELYKNSATQDRAAKSGLPHSVPRVLSTAPPQKT